MKEEEYHQYINQLQGDEKGEMDELLVIVTVFISLIVVVVLVLSLPYLKEE